MEQIQGTIGIGAKIKELRKKKKITLAVMAKGLGMSYSYLSNLENEKCSISVVNLQRICDYLDVDMVYFFSSSAQNEKAEVIKKESVVQYATQDGLVFKVLTGGYADTMEVQRIYHPPFGPSERRTYRHKYDGEEFITVLTGTLYVEIAGEKHCLHSGDSILFKSRAEHSIYTAEEEAEFLLISASPSAEAIKG